jgi:type II secretory pathway pseudopilin PulG
MLTAPNHHPQLGFTLIEVLVITGLTVIILLSTVTLFLTFMVNQASLSRKQAVKIAGDNVLKQMEQTLRGVRGVTNCNTGQSEVSFYDFTSKNGRFYVDSNRIASDAGNQTYYLTTDDIGVSNFNIDCYPGQNQELVRFSFTLTDDSGLGLSDTAIEQVFATSVSVRN